MKSDSDSLRRVSIVLATLGGATPLTNGHEMTTDHILEGLENQFPHRDHKRMTVAYALHELVNAERAVVVSGKLPMTFRLTQDGFERAMKHWIRRDSLGYQDPPPPEPS